MPNPLLNIFRGSGSSTKSTARKRKKNVRTIKTKGSESFISLHKMKLDLPFLVAERRVDQNTKIESDEDVMSWGDIHIESDITLRIQNGGTLRILR